uniref:G-patch domain and ankyrin repeats 1 n=1 Tax=Acanthochromis polyacanthus TaxID=80966 RepID=A0A3Q1HD26_9TELE
NLKPVIAEISHSLWLIETGQSSSKTVSVLSGEEARQFYENLINDGTRQDGSRRATSKKNGEGEDDQRRDTSTSERSAELKGLRLLRCAHEGDVSGIKELVTKGVDINFQDTFFWTAVMCASWSGQKTALSFLLDHGAAWVGVVDTQGRDAKDLAQEAGHSEVLEELLNYGRSTQRETQSNSRLANTYLHAFFLNQILISNRLYSVIH